MTKKERIIQAIVTGFLYSIVSLGIIKIREKQAWEFSDILEVFLITFFFALFHYLIMPWFYKNIR